MPRENNSVTVWLALDDADSETGVVQYAKGSHLWPMESVTQDVSGSSFHGDTDPKEGLRRAASQAGLELDDVEVEPLTVPAGSAVLHHQDVWHGSGENRSKSRHRRALGIHLIRRDVRFVEKPGYIYGRYMLPGTEGRLQDAFFPVTYQR